jgi:hypothetical protein
VKLFGRVGGSPETLWQLDREDTVFHPWADRYLEMVPGSSNEGVLVLDGVRHHVIRRPARTGGREARSSGGA